MRILTASRSGGDGVGMAIKFGLAGCLQKRLEKVGRVRAAISFDPFGVRERFGGMVTPGFGLAACTRGYAYFDRFAVRGGDGVGMAIGFGLAGCLQKGWRRCAEHTLPAGHGDAAREDSGEGEDSGGRL